MKMAHRLPKQKSKRIHEKVKTAYTFVNVILLFRFIGLVVILIVQAKEEWLLTLRGLRKGYSVLDLVNGLIKIRIRSNHCATIEGNGTSTNFCLNELNSSGLLKLNFIAMPCCKSVHTKLF